MVIRACDSAPGRRVTTGSFLNADFPLGSVPHEAGMEPLRLLLASVMLVILAKDPLLPQVSGRVPDSRFASRCR